MPGGGPASRGWTCWRTHSSTPPITTSVMQRAASLWADARNSGIPTAADPSLDGDVILAAQALGVATGGEAVVVATTNVATYSATSRLESGRRCESRWGRSRGGRRRSLGGG